MIKSICKSLPFVSF